jgi:hypothetical protein
MYQLKLINLYVFELFIVKDDTNEETTVDGSGHVTDDSTIETPIRFPAGMCKDLFPRIHHLLPPPPATNLPNGASCTTYENCLSRYCSIHNVCATHPNRR